MKKNILLYSMILCLSACSALKMHILKRAIKEPIVETKETTKNFLLKNGFDTVNSFILKGDTALARKSLEGSFNGYAVFDNSGKRLCYNGNATCSGVQTKSFITGKMNEFASCDGKQIDLADMFVKVYDLEGKNIDFKDITKADGYLLTFWRQAWGGRRGYQEDVDFVDKEILKQSNRKIIHIRVNTDLQDTWGLQAGKKISRKFTKKNGELFIEYGELPYQK